jgi:predicted Zn finger-like uncharacterized protein
MILTCPDCGTQYVVKDGAIPPEGRQVRCAACKHSWHQDPEPVAPLELQPEAAISESEAQAETATVEEAEQPAVEDESLAEATLIEPRSGPEAEERAYEEALIEDGPATSTVDETIIAEGGVAVEEPDTVETPAPQEDWNEPPHGEAAPDMFSPFADDSDLEPRRRSPITTLLILALLVIALAALFWFFAPADLKAKLGLTASDASPLALVTTHMDRQRLASGNELLTVTGRVINPTAKEQDVPPLQAQLRTRTGKVVYSWTIAPPARSLPAGASASFNSAEVNVPPGGDELTITLGEPKA